MDRKGCPFHRRRRCGTLSRGGALSGGRSPVIDRLSRDRVSFVFDPAAEPVVTLASGDSIVVETQDAHSGTITGPEVVYRTLEDVMERIGGANPVTGPIAIDGVEPGDLIAIELGPIDGAPVSGFGYMTTTPTLHPDLDAETVICRRLEDEVEIPTSVGPVRVPYRPFVGTLGVAPAQGSLPSFSQHRDVLGNVDLPELTSGATVVLRANVPGALLSLGDAHLVQGDAEIHRSAVEAQADVEITVTRLDDATVVYGGLPQVNTERELGSIAPGPGHLEDLVRSAYDDLALRLQRGYGLSLADAYRLLGAVGAVRVGQVVPPVYSAAAKIERRYVEERQ